MEEQQARYVIGKRDASGSYPVAVDGSPAGTIYRRHGYWFAVMPGHQIDSRFPNGTGGVSSGRYAAAAHLVTLTDQGKCPTIPAQSPHTPLGTSIAHVTGTETYAHLIPDLRLSLPNLVRAAEAMARLAQLGWTPLAGYPGADQPWHMECRLCGWQGYRFWSKLRGRNGDGKPQPITRHPGCIPVKDHHLALINLAAERSRTCECPRSHPTDVADAGNVLTHLHRMLTGEADMTARIYSRLIIEPCPAATRRAEALRDALNRRTHAQRAKGQPTS
ncbi:hypothetical protein [Streptomyces sp. NPDC002952]|uniref:hypothetical protein n=1 Tax=Streptomyces sp. NPDC002952 TaxID=3364673 RepID=UPI0036A1ED96